MHYSNYSDLVRIAVSANLNQSVIAAADLAVANFVFAVQSDVDHIPAITVQQPIGQSIETLATWLVDNAEAFKASHPDLSALLNVCDELEADALSILYAVMSQLAPVDLESRFEPVEKALTSLGISIADHFACQCAGTEAQDLAFGGLLVKFEPDTEEQLIPLELMTSDPSSDWAFASGYGA